MRVRLDTRQVGQAFGCEGLLRLADGPEAGMIVATTDQTYPHGFVTAALDGARALAERSGHEVVPAAE